MDTTTGTCYYTFKAAAQNSLIEAASRVLLLARSAGDDDTVMGDIMSNLGNGGPCGCFCRVILMCR